VSVVKDLTATVTQCAYSTVPFVFNDEYAAVYVLQFKARYKTLKFIVIMDSCKEYCTVIYGNTNSMFCQSLSILSKQFALQVFQIPNNIWPLNYSA